MGLREEAGAWILNQGRSGTGLTSQREQDWSQSEGAELGRGVPESEGGLSVPGSEKEGLGRSSSVLPGQPSWEHPLPGSAFSDPTCISGSTPLLLWTLEVGRGPEGVGYRLHSWEWLQ